VVLPVTPSLSAQTVKDLVALIRANAGKYSYASPATGNPLARFYRGEDPHRPAGPARRGQHC
jgi:tripartite-type tricarboxylate transporter receptor subunit TctC